MNSDFYEDLDTNFELACKMSEQDFTHNELIELLKHGNIPEKQIAALRLDDIFNVQEASILINNLTGCDGKIREAVALRINNIVKTNLNSIQLFAQNDFVEDFANATIDINGNICRLVIDTVALLKANQEFSKKYLDRILGFIQSTFDELDKFIFRDKKYVINKQLFKLYWSLESLKLFVNEIDENILTKILNRICFEKEYTIREQAANILNNTAKDKYKELKKQLSNDENYYVRISCRLFGK